MRLSRAYNLVETEASEASERLHRRLERLLDQIDEAEADGNWESVHDLALDVLAIDASASALTPT